MQSPPKPQFADWLVEQVETDQYPGLKYVGPNRFRVPWKHNSRRDCNDADNQIFRAWAVASGKIREFPTDKARWKTNFRCALNNLKERFNMVEDNSKSADPHKVYQIINAAYNQDGLPTQESQEDNPVLYCSPVDCFPPGAEPILLSNFMALDLGQQPAEEPPAWREDYGLGGYPAAAPQHNYCQVAPPPQPSIYDLEVSIHYRKKEMLRRTVSVRRLQLHYGQDELQPDAHHLCFPPTDSLLDHKQRDFTNRLLGSIQRGLLLEVRDSGIYAWRQDHCHVFASTSDPGVTRPDRPEPAKLPQNAMVELLSFAKFVHDLKQFKENSGGSPEYVINMCFGEKFPDGKPLEKKLIVVKVVPLICRHLHEMTQLEGASSLQSANLSLQISHNSLFDLINSIFAFPNPEELLLRGGGGGGDAHFLQGM